MPSDKPERATLAIEVVKANPGAFTFDDWWNQQGHGVEQFHPCRDAWQAALAEGKRRAALPEIGRGEPIKRGDPVEKHFPATPRTDALLVIGRVLRKDGWWLTGDEWVRTEEVRQLERELVEANERAEAWHKKYQGLCQSWYKIQMGPK